MGRDNNTQVAARLGVSASTVGRWFTGTTPDPVQVVNFAREYDASPIAALLASGHLTKSDVERDVSFFDSSGLDEYSTATLIKEIESRLEVMGVYAGWVKSLVRDERAHAGLGPDMLRFLDPFTAPAKTDGSDFAQILPGGVQQKFAGNDIAFLQPRNVGGPGDDLEDLDETAGETTVQHEEDTDDYTP